LTMRDAIDITIPSDPKMMRLVRKTVAQACEMVGFDSRVTHAITLAVDEGCTNIIRHCYGGSLAGSIVVRICLYGDRIEIFLRDFGDSIDLQRLQRCIEKRRREIESSKAPLRPGGLGVILIHSVMDKVKYRTSSKSGTVLKLVKYLSATGEKKVAIKRTS